MAKQTSLITFNGRVGNLVGSKDSQGKLILREYNPSPRNPNTLRQQTQRTRFSAVTSFLRMLPEDALIGFTAYAKQKKLTNINAAVKEYFKLGLYSSFTTGIGVGNVSTVVGQSPSEVNHINTSACVYSKGSEDAKVYLYTPDWNDPNQITCRCNIEEDGDAYSPRAQMIVVIVNDELMEAMVLKYAKGQLNSQMVIETPERWNGTKVTVSCYWVDMDETSAAVYYDNEIGYSKADVRTALANAVYSKTRHCFRGTLS